MTSVAAGPRRGVRPEHAESCLARASAVCFDVDSTVITVEAIDELAAYAGKKAEVAAITARCAPGVLG
jgi:phosphoserine phosphatase